MQPQTDGIKMIKLVDDIDQAWKWLTMQISALLIVLPPAWAMLTEQQQSAIIAMLPFAQDVRGWQALMALGAAVMAARVIKQGLGSK